MNKINRSRLENLMIFFAQNTLACGKIKLFKLLYLLDFEHFSLTGKSVTGLEYQAWDLGPVPVDLMDAWEFFDQHFSKSLFIEYQRVIDYTRQAVRVVDGVTFDDQDFTPRQLKLMTGLAEKYKDTLSPELIDVTHEQNGAWDKVWNNGNGRHQPIPYELALSNPDSEHAKEVRAISDEESMYLSSLQKARSLIH